MERQKMFMGWYKANLIKLGEKIHLKLEWFISIFFLLIPVI